ncbi:MAG: helix-turn-helix domain-containing protein [Alphaproteobacteria bacterium]|nr:helix-turn-helix domain-containing protein [Alphaproteobacteria bacterium]
MKARLARLGPVRDADPPPMSLAGRAVIVLRRTGALTWPISVLHLLRPAGMTLRAAHAAITRLAERGWAVCEINADADMASLRQDLGTLNVEIRRRTPVRESLTDIAAVRARHGLSQREFADLLGIDLRTLQNWEQGRNRPDDAALSLVLMFDRAPEFVEETLSEPVG